jgi:hypothetical protein
VEFGNRKQTEAGGRKAGISLIILIQQESERLQQGAAVFCEAIRMFGWKTQRSESSLIFSVMAGAFFLQ